jgi:acyl-CoA thioesterase FadM
MQETANHHLDSMGMPLDEIRDTRDVGFILSKLAMQVYAPLHAYDKIDVETWVGDDRGFRFHRAFRILRDNETIAEALTVWGLIRLSDHSLVRVEDFDAPFQPEALPEMKIPARIRFPLDPLLDRGTRTVRYSDADYNEHMNNTPYPNMLCDFLPDMHGKFLTSINLSYVNEAQLGETLHGYARQDGDVWYVRTVRENGDTNAEARITLTDL